MYDTGQLAVNVRQGRLAADVRQWPASRRDGEASLAAVGVWHSRAVDNSLYTVASRGRSPGRYWKG